MSAGRPLRSDFHSARSPQRVRDGLLNTSFDSQGGSNAQVGNQFLGNFVCSNRKGFGLGVIFGSSRSSDSVISWGQQYRLSICPIDLVMKIEIRRQAACWIRIDSTPLVLDYKGRTGRAPSKSRILILTSLAGEQSNRIATSLRNPIS